MTQVNLTIRIDEDLKKELRQAAKLENKTLTDYLLDNAKSSLHFKFRENELEAIQALKNELHQMRQAMAEIPDSYLQILHCLFVLERLSKAKLLKILQIYGTLEEVYPTTVKKFETNEVKKLNDMINKFMENAEKEAEKIKQ